MAQQTDVRSGVHTIFNEANGQVIYKGSSTTQNTGVLPWGWNGGRAQQWYFFQNPDTSWNIINMLSGQVLDDPDGNTTHAGRKAARTKSLTASRDRSPPLGKHWAEERQSFTS